MNWIYSEELIAGRVLSSNIDKTTDRRKIDESKEAVVRGLAKIAGALDEWDIIDQYFSIRATDLECNVGKAAAVKMSNRRDIRSCNRYDGGIRSPPPVVRRTTEFSEIQGDINGRSRRNIERKVAAAGES